MTNGITTRLSKDKFRGGKKNLWRSIILKKKWFLSARYLELQTAQSWDNILRKYCYFLVLFFHHFLGTGYWPLIETGHCRDRSFVWPSTAILVFLCSGKNPYFNSLPSGYHHNNPSVNSLPLPEAFLTMLSLLHLQHNSGLAIHDFTPVESAVVLKNRSPFAVPSSGRSLASGLVNCMLTLSWSSQPAEWDHYS